MNELLKSNKIPSDKDLTGLRNFFDNIESHVRSLQGLGIESKNYGSLLTPIILERLTNQLKLTISRNLKSEIWNLDEILMLINEEVRAQKVVLFQVIVSTVFQMMKSKVVRIICHILRA